eukprot:11079118-Lingulodinium_polyedra.AAC.1
MDSDSGRLEGQAPHDPDGAAAPLSRGPEGGGPPASDEGGEEQALAVANVALPPEAKNDELEPNAEPAPRPPEEQGPEPVPGREGGLASELPEEPPPAAPAGPREAGA